MKEGNLEQLVFAPIYEEAPIPAADEPVFSILDNPDINKEPEEADHVDVFGEEIDQ